MAVMTEAIESIVPVQRDRRARPAVTSGVPAAVLRISSNRPIGAQQPLLVPAAAGGPAIAPLLPIHRDRRSRRARRGSSRRLTVLAVAFGVSLLMWVVIIGGVLALAHTL